MPHLMIRSSEVLFANDLKFSQKGWHGKSQYLQDEMFKYLKDRIN